MGERSEIGGEPRAQSVIDCEGGTLLPGFHDAHIHLLASAARLSALDCSGARSLSDIEALVRERASALPLGTWVRAVGYDETALVEQRHPDRWLLDAAAPAHPVRLQHRSYHGCVVNSLGLKEACIAADTEEPPGGIIERDLETGDPTGLLLETAQELVRRAMPPMRPGELRQGVKAVSDQLLKWGVTAVQDATASNSMEDWDLFDELQESGALRQRVTLMMGFGSVRSTRFSAPAVGVRAPALRPRPPAGERLRLGAIKIILDESTGRLHPSLPDLKEQVLAVHRAGCQVALHVVTRGALDAALSALEHAQTTLFRPDARHRIEHCSVCTPEQAGRIAALGAYVCTQPGFLHDSGDRYLREVAPEDLPFLYPVRTLGEAGVGLAGGSDSPVSSPDPFTAIRAAVTRHSARGARLSPEQGIGFESAIDMYTIGSAAAAFQEHELGRIAPGYLADLVLLPAGRLSARGLPGLEPWPTIVGGEIVWDGRH